jgi:MFS transporter, SHS family, sialic acid transporter
MNSKTASAADTSSDSSATGNARASSGAKLALTAALLGWMFDGAEMGVFTLIGRPALKNLLPPDTAESQIALFMGVITAMFLVGAATGGVLFGWLGDRIGRVRAMMLSVLCYAVFTSLCGLVNSPIQLGVMRFIASLGMGGEWALGVALVMEVWPDRSRAFMAGLIGAAANVGYVLVGVTGLMLTSLILRVESGLLAIGLSEAWVEHLTANNGWRLLMIFGIVPAILTFFIRMFVPESHKWEAEKKSGNASHWATIDLLGVLIGALGPALMVYAYANSESTILFRIGATIIGVAVAAVGYTYPVVRYLGRLSQSQSSGTKSGETKTEVGSTIRRMFLAACLSGVALLGTWGSTQQAPTWVSKLTEADPTIKYAREYTLIYLSVGAVIGTLISAWLGEKIGRRPAYFLQCILSMLSILLLFQCNTQYGTGLLISAFIAGACTASFYGWLPLYLPELFGTKVRATGQGFGFNFGRIIAAVGTFQLGALTAYFQGEPGTTNAGGGYPMACTSLSLIYVVGMVLIWFAPETKGKELPD